MTKVMWLCVFTYNINAYIGVCKMERTRQKGLKKCSDYVEVSFLPNESYLDCVHKAVDALEWDYDPEDGVPSFCRTSGCKIMNQPLPGTTEQWTIGTYLKSVYRSTNNAKLGVALFEVLKYLLFNLCLGVAYM